jgi:hypothetical protein
MECDAVVGCWEGSVLGSGDGDVGGQDGEGHGGGEGWARHRDEFGWYVLSLDDIEVQCLA